MEKGAPRSWLTRLPKFSLLKSSMCGFQFLPNFLFSCIVGVSSRIYQISRGCHIISFMKWSLDETDWSFES